MYCRPASHTLTCRPNAECQACSAHDRVLIVKRWEKMTFTRMHGLHRLTGAATRHGAGSGALEAQQQRSPGGAVLVAQGCL